MTACCPLCGSEYAVGQGRCWACNVAWAGSPPPPTLAVDQPDDEVEYELDDWGVQERVLLASALAERGIPCRWEPGPVLVVLEADEGRTEVVLDEIEATGDVDGGEADVADEEAVGGGEGDDDEEDGGTTAQAAMGDLFVAADRLMHEPSDSLLAAELGTAAAEIDDSPPPYGIDAEVWDRVRDLAGALVADLDAGADEEAVRQGARTVRDVLRPFV